MSDLTFWACVRFSLQLMFCGGLQTFHLPRKKNFRFRLFLGGAGYFVIVFLIFHGLRLAFWNLLLGEILYYVLMFLTGLFLVRLCFQVSEKELVFIGTGAYAMQHMTFNLTQIFTYIPVLGEQLGESMLWNSVFPYLAVPALVYYFLIRKFRKQGELKEKDTRMLLLSLVTIFITIVVSLGARMAGGSPLQELIYYIEKLDINEEKQRLANHLKYFRETMAGGHGQGKKLGFIAQEMGREINTTGSKSNHAEMQNIVVQMKDELEQIKEQVLNAL